MAVPVSAPIVSIRTEGSALVHLRWQDIELGVLNYNIYRVVFGAYVPPAQGGLGDEVDQVIIAKENTGGDFTLTYNGGTTDPIAFDASADDVRLALEALSDFVPGDILVTKAALGILNTSTDNPQYWIEFTGAFARTNVLNLTADFTNLTGGAPPMRGSVGTFITGGAYDTAVLGLSWFDTNPAHNQANWYEVRAVNVDGEGPASTRVHISFADPVLVEGTPTAALRINRAL